LAARTVTDTAPDATRDPSSEEAPHVEATIVSGSRRPPASGDPGKPTRRRLRRQCRLSARRRFDLTWLRDTGLKAICGAELVNGEDIVFQHFNDPVAEAANGSCIGQVGLAPRNWPEILARRDSPDSPTPALLPVEPVDGERSYGSWDVTREIQQTVAGQEFFGFVVHPSDANLDAGSDSACLSHLAKLRLRLYYAIL
jgi:hypothetical protein